MKNHDFRIAVFAVALLVSLGVFFGGYTLDRELTDRNTRAGLTALGGGPVNLDRQGKVTVISVEPGQVDNLQETWKSLSEFIERDTAKDNYRIIIQDKRNSHLKEAFDQLQPAVYEAAANNTFVALQHQLAEYLGGKDINYRFYIDNERLYLQMQDGDYYLYQVIERVNNQATITGEA